MSGYLLEYLVAAPGAAYQQRPCDHCNSLALTASSQRRPGNKSLNVVCSFAFLLQALAHISHPLGRGASWAVVRGSVQLNIGLTQL